MTARENVVPLAAIGARPPVDTLRRPIHDLRISVMDRCNFRCPYCMPRETFHESYRFLKSNERLDFAEILRLARVFTRAGVRKLRITGGEPRRISLTAPVEVKAPLAYYLPVRLKNDDWGRTSAEPCPTNGSGDFTALAGTQGFVELPPGPNTYPKGFVARFYGW